MPSAFDVPAKLLIDRIADELMKDPHIKPPEWADYVKTGVHKEAAPTQENWWYYRAASVLRTIYFRGPIGVSRLRKKYGGRHRRGVKPEHFARGSGSIIRKILQQLEKAGYIEKTETHKGKGRIFAGRSITPKGRSFIDKLAAEIKKTIPELERY